jgi:hypothetical protein
MAASRPGPPAWLLTRWALGQVAADPAARAGLARARVCQLLGPGQQPLECVPAEPVLICGSVTRLRQAIGCHGIPNGASAVLYDPEAWPFTPSQEQRDPAAATARAATLARRHGLRLMVAPALSLTRVLAPGDGGPRWRRFLDLGVAAATARHADVFEVQAQSLARDTGSYAGFVRAAAAQARAAHPGIQVLAGLSTNPPGAPVTLGQLTDAVRATRHAVDGYWLNIPRPGRHCPTCNPPRPGLGVALLREFA